MQPLPERKASRTKAKSDAVKMNEVDPSLRNPPIAVPRPTAATDTPSQIAKADKELLEKIKSGELVVVAAGEAKPVAAAKKTPTPATPAAGWVPNA